MSYLSFSNKKENEISVGFIHMSIFHNSVLDFSEDSIDENSSEDEDGSNEKKPTIEKLKSKAIPIGNKRRELYRNMASYMRQDTVQDATDINDDLKRAVLLENVENKKTKSSSRTSLSFFKRMIPWNSSIWNVQVTSINNKSLLYLHYKRSSLRRIQVFYIMICTFRLLMGLR